MQFPVMIVFKMMGNFGGVSYWLEHFKPLCKADCWRMGLLLDCGMSFITLDKHPFNDSVVRWQFREKNKSKDS